LILDLAFVFGTSACALASRATSSVRLKQQPQKVVTESMINNNAN
jgi:hypothetical protein